MKLASAAEQLSTESERASDSPLTHDDKTTVEVAEKERTSHLSHSSVSQEIAELKKKLDSRKKMEQPDLGVEKAKEELVQCLRMNDRRPLDCWKEKEAFKREVGRLEREFVERAVR
jgi:altered-inheritance-of-mitochondria protein 13